MKHCSGCGVALQTEDEQKPGFVPTGVLDKEHVICQRCHRLKHYDDMLPVELDDDDFLRVLHEIGERRGFIVHIVDLFDLGGSWISGLQRFVNHQPILLVANKIDLFPQSMHWHKIKQRLHMFCRDMGLKPVDILLCSAEKGLGIERVMKAMEIHRQGKDVYVVGTTNAGKSTLINQILKKFHVHEKEWLTTSRLPGTTLDFIDIPLKDGSHLFDTPGVINRRQIAYYVAEEEWKVIFPKKRVKPRVYQLDARKTLFLGGLARVDFISGERQSFVCYLSNLLKVHRTKLEKADDLYAEHAGELLSPPAKANMADWPEMKKHTFKISAEPTDIVFAGLGWVSVKGAGAVVEAYAPDGVDVSVRPALI